MKGEIIDKYLRAYLTIFQTQSWCKGTLYVDAFAGAIESVVRGTGELVAGSARRALGLSPGFSEYHFIDIDRRKAFALSELAEDYDNVFVYDDDGNKVIRETIVPKLSYRRYWRGVVLLDPYGLDLEWDVVHSLGKNRTADVIVNFPTMDMNRNALRRDVSTVSDAAAQRMTRWWGDGSWRDEFYKLSPQKGLWDEQATVKAVDNDTVVEAYRRRLKEVASFPYVTQPFPMKNRSNATLYYLLLASQKESAVAIMNEILQRYRR